MTKEQKEILKAWANHKGFEIFIESKVREEYNRKRNELDELDLDNEEQRRRAKILQSDIKAVKTLIYLVESCKGTVVHNPEN